MSRSRKKQPYFSCADRSKVMKKWKTFCNRSVRKNPSEDVKAYKKLHDVWQSPSDGKYYRDGPKGYRK